MKVKRSVVEKMYMENMRRCTLRKEWSCPGDAVVVRCEHMQYNLKFFWKYYVHFNVDSSFDRESRIAA
ncbi:hypothetical protein GQ600_24214 [Phytophthora cactorum]|nr:hypothetical protein GQ600_24214 [Phytophthora cactorum]